MLYVLTIYRLFTAHMAGNSAHLGEQLVRKNWSAALLAASVIACFLLGSIFGRLIIELGARTGLRRIASFTLVIECVLLVAVRRGGAML